MKLNIKKTKVDRKKPNAISPTMEKIGQIVAMQGKKK